MSAIATADTLSWMPRKQLPIAEKKVQLAARIDPDLYEFIAELAREDDRTVSYITEKLLRESQARRLDAKLRDKRR